MRVVSRTTPNTSVSIRIGHEGGARGEGVRN